MDKKQQIIVLAAITALGLGGSYYIKKMGGESKKDKAISEQQKPTMAAGADISYYAPVHAPTSTYAPHTDTTVTKIIHNVIAPITPLTETTPTPSKKNKWIAKQVKAGVGAYLNPEELEKFKQGERVNVSMTPR